MTEIAIIGGGPGGLMAAIALARRGVRTTVFEREDHPERMPRFNPDRSYPIDITGHGLKAVRHIDALTHFDAHLTAFHGISGRAWLSDPWLEPGWIGSRGDITRALMSVVEDRHHDMIDFVFHSEVRTVDVLAGEVAGQSFDLVIGADGAGSAVRAAMRDQVAGFTVETSSVPNYGLLLELDQVGEKLDKHCPNGLAVNPPTLAAVIRDEDKPDGVRWLSVIGLGKPITFTSPVQATTWLRKHCPRVLDLTSEQAISEFSRREYVHLGQRATCSQLYGGRAVLLGDAAAAFPPAGQGGNAALESAMVLDQCLAAGPPETVGARYNSAWKPEADAVSWIGAQVRYQDVRMILRMTLARAVGVDIGRLSKSSTRSYSDVRRAARRLGPIWA
ncbi:MAG: symbB [Amycolatopsis sp.]|uniref:FAD-dependent oxidoreductase n=1 Tax=Amycolatopsis sp. TaxID=37632 RepID=UPI002622400E|nr:FAD-dependent monooxygenase [Amycolatopsis sp.]MCU1687459.1 symbB [Amycolatopsis sp.]